MKPLNLSDTYFHYNNLIWQLPTWCLAITTGVLLAISQIEKDLIFDEQIIETKIVSGLLSFIGFLLILGLGFALYKYRLMQAASVSGDAPSPPFGSWPSVNSMIQVIVFIDAVFLLFISLMKFFELFVLSMLISLAICIFFCILIEILHKKNRSKIDIEA